MRSKRQEKVQYCYCLSKPQWKTISYWVVIIFSTEENRYQSWIPVFHSLAKSRKNSSPAFNGYGWQYLAMCRRLEWNKIVASQERGSSDTQGRGHGIPRLKWAYLSFQLSTMQAEFQETFLTSKVEHRSLVFQLPKAAA